MFICPIKNKEPEFSSNSYTSCFKIIFRVPQGSILGPLLFRIFLADFILKDVDIAKFAEDNAPYTYAKNTDESIEF